MTDAAATRRRKRYEAARRKHGPCIVCTARDHSRLSACAIPDRTPELCCTDGAVPRFQLDVEAMTQFEDRRGGRYG
jgi:hypothetical protein